MHDDPKSASEDDGEEHVWRFGYGSNIALTTLREKKNLNPRRHLVGAIRGWRLYFSPGIPYVEPGFAAIRPAGEEEGSGADGKIHELHGSAFLIPKGEADGLDRQEGGYAVFPSRFVAYDGEVIEGVGLYVPRKYVAAGGDLAARDADDPGKAGVPSLRYLRLLRRGAREAKLSEAWMEKLESFGHYVTPDDVRDRTLRWIEEFRDGPERDSVWTAEDLSKHDGSAEHRPAHVAAMQYVVKISPKSWVFSSWKGHCVTRRNLLHYHCRSVDTNDIRWNEDGFRPMPNISNCSEEEREYLLQNLETLLHRGGTIVARLKECIDDGGEMAFDP